MQREGVDDIVTANIKRCQEAARVLEEFAKIMDPEASLMMKEIRFKLYSFEKNLSCNEAKDPR